ncbi:MAG: hypothetical protein EOM90_10120 [Alphaproteobacteria bacterium]|nr:hypothetical protein [Alphaproteobacteria bacterium]
MKIFIGIDNTDNTGTQDTGSLARALAESFAPVGLFAVRTITRHQLLVDRRIPFTTHNSAASITGVCKGSLADLIDHTRKFLLKTSACDADPGMCVATGDDITADLLAFGNRAKREILTMNDAYRVISGTSIFLEGLKKTRLGLIGALAAVSLRAGGNDGRLLWTRNLLETTGSFPISEFLSKVDVDRVVEKDFNEPSPSSVIMIGDWCQPVLIGGKVTLIAEKADNKVTYEYQSASTAYIKSISE